MNKHAPGAWMDHREPAERRESALRAELCKTAAERDRLKAVNAQLVEALKPLAGHADIIEQHFIAEDLDAMDQDHHLIARGITVADCFQARAALTVAKEAS